jgi:outer membrane protein OmpA-like peptidoglycan-associated protein
MSFRSRLLATCGFACSFVVASNAPAQQVAPGFSTQRFNPSERGSEFFALDTLDMRGDGRPAVGVVGEWANRPFVLYNADGSDRAAVVSQQLFVHVGASLNLFDRLRIAVNVPFALVDSGDAGKSLLGQTYNGPSHLALGDMRFSADLRLFGRYGGAFTMALGGQMFLPAGEAKQYTGDVASHGIVHLLASGEIGMIVYSAKLGFHVRDQLPPANGAVRGDELVFGGAIGLRLANRKLVVGPEVYGSTGTATSNAFFGAGTTPVEALLGAHYTVAPDWRIGVGAGPGLTHDLGSPQVRVIASVEWVPAYVPERPRPTVGDRDGDRIPDNRDACPDHPGQPNDDPRMHGCPQVAAVAPPPPPDRDGDGIPDTDDACPDKPGVKTDDPKTNGCPPPPPDRDGDGIVDAEDACPDKAGVKTDDPKTNGCPPNPDRDGDGIANEVDACPDAAGPKNDDPKKNGCPAAAEVGGQIKITDQVKFATGSAVLLKESDTILSAVLKVLQDHPEIKVIRVEGHTDNQGPAAYNKTLSQKRAASVEAWLEKHGIDKNRVKSEGFGMEKPIDDNKTEAGRKNNRRVEFHIEDTK